MRSTLERPHDRAADLARRTFELWLHRVMRAVSARVVVKLLDKDAVIHESTVPFSWVLPFCYFLCYFYYFSISDLRSTAKELMYERRANIGLDQDVRFIEREHAHCARCVIAHSWNRANTLRVCCIPSRSTLAARLKVALLQVCAVGNTLRNSLYFSSTRETCVC